MRTTSDPPADTGSGASTWAGSPAPSPFGIRVILPDSIDRTPITSMSELLQARVPGLSVQRISGTTGSASRIRLRGTRSTVRSSTPLVIVDGLRVEVAESHWFGESISGLQPDAEWSSKLDDIDPEDIERIEILGGPAAASRFGRGAANGAILVTTKRGSRDGIHWTAHSSFGTISQATAFPASYDQRGIAINTGEHIDYCGLIEQSRHNCSAIADSLLTSNALELHSPFESGTRSQLGLSGSAGNEAASLYVTGDFTREHGTLEFNVSKRNHVLANGRVRPFRWLEVGARAGYTRGSLSGIPPGRLADVFYSGLTGGPNLAEGYRVPLDSIALQATTRSTAHFIAGGTATWSPLAWLNISGTLGVDRDRWIEDQQPEVIQPGFAPTSRTNYSSETSTARVEASAAWRIGSSLRLGSGVGVEKVKYKNEGRIVAYNLAAPVDGPRAASEFWLRDRLDSRFGHIDLSWQNRISLMGGLRQDEIRSGDGPATYPSFGAAWQISNESWFPREGALSMLRVRAAYGEAGQSRFPLDREEFFTPATPDASEAELGIDAGGFAGRATVALTYYKGRSDARVWYQGPPGFPSSPPPTLHRSVRSSGVEAALTASLVERGSLRVHLDATAAFPRNSYRGQPTYVGSLDAARQTLISGYPVGGYWAPPIIGFEDRQLDGRIGIEGCRFEQFPSASTCEVQLGEYTYLGSPLPTKELSLRPGLTLGRATLSALFDYRGGNKLLNRTEYLRCLLEVCRAAQDPEAPLADQTRVVAAMLGSAAGYLEDGSYWKFRELSVGIAAPERWAARVGARRLNVTLAARNLATWTSYSGFDPEVDSEGYESLLVTDTFAQPPVRYFIMRLDIGW